MNILLIGSGGREHALAWKLRQSPLVGRLFAAPGNPGIGEEAVLVPLDPADHAAIVRFCRAESIDLVVIGPEGPLVAGIVDALEAAGLRAFGPSRAAARLEGSKGFTKDLCTEAGIPTAAYRRFSDAVSARDHVRAQGAPIVVKADGLAAGKGVTVAATVEEATAAIDACFAGAFGGAGAEVVVEEFLLGEEASLFALSDGETVISFGTARDYKRAYDGDRGPNTGGMGAVSPAPALSPQLVDRAMAEIVRPTIAAMARRGTPFRGVLYAGLMLTAAGPKLIEYNVRFGDPECQVLMRRLDDDLAPILMAAASGRLAALPPPVWSAEPALTVVIAAAFYPGEVRRGDPIAGLAAAAAEPDVTLFHAGTTGEAESIVTAGGRVLSVTARAASVADARARAYAAAARISWPGAFHRHDIGAPETGA